jgi:hypothetical protein
MPVNNGCIIKLQYIIIDGNRGDYDKYPRRVHSARKKSEATIHREMDRAREHDGVWTNPDTKGQILIFHLQNLDFFRIIFIHLFLLYVH